MELFHLTQYSVKKERESWYFSTLYEIKSYKTIFHPLTLLLQNVYVWIIYSKLIPF